MTFEQSILALRVLARGTTKVCYVVIAVSSQVQLKSLSVNRNVPLVDALSLAAPMVCSFSTVTLSWFPVSTINPS